MLNTLLKKIILVSTIGMAFPVFASQTSPIIIEQITTSAEPSKIPNKNFSMTIKLKTGDTTLTHWALGFYMPRSFNTVINSAMNVAINIDLVREICPVENPSHCSPLQVVKKPARYATTGFTTVLSPVDDTLQLNAGKTYLIKLTNDNQGIPNNYSAMPQSFFIIQNDSKVIPITDVTPAHYQFAANDQLAQIAVAKHNTDNWLQSKAQINASLADQYHLVPTPATIQQTDAEGFTFAPSGHVTVTDEFTNDASNKKLLASYLKKDLHITSATAAENGTITFKKIELDNPEAYQLQIANHAIVISASNPAGIFYGLQTLRQLWFQNKVLPGLIIEDCPRFKYRGILLDVARHFFTVKELEKFIDVMAAQKLNTLHIHFADDEAWRLATGNVLTTVGSVRGFSPRSKLAAAVLPQANLDISNHKDFSPSGSLTHNTYTTANQRYAGHYSQTDIKTLITYANARQITIIPEIDLPGHARALVNVLPHIFQDANNQTSVDNVIPVCLYQQQTEQGKVFTDTIDKIIEAINTMFSGQATLYHTAEVSVAGDEVSKLAWINDPSCTGVWAKMSALSKSHYFLAQLKHPSLLSGWQQLVQNDDGTLDQTILPTTAISHLWVWDVTHEGGKSVGIINAASLINAGYPTVLAFGDDAYFDLAYTPEIWEPGYHWATAFSDTHAALHLASAASQTEQLVTPNQRNNLLGLEGALWSENLINVAHLAYMALPKMTGLAEAAWASADITTDVSGNVNWHSLVYRLGTDQQGFLAYLYQISQMKYRGYPHGITSEIPTTDEKI